MSGTTVVRVLVTGATGFVGPYLISRLREMLGQDATIVATARRRDASASDGSLVNLDVTDDDAVDRVVAEVDPTHVIHMAAITSFSNANADTKTTWQVNTFGTLAVAEAILRRAPHCVLIFAGSGLVYGASAKAGRTLDEATLLAPNSDYAATKAAADLALGALAVRGLRTIRLRLFNHTGPGQTEDFVVPSFAAQIARIEVGLQPQVMRVGNMDAARDFLDVRDVANAYALTVVRSPELSSGITLNIASGTPRTIRSVLDKLLALSRVPIAVEIDPSRLRPNDTPFYVGNASAAGRLLGWQPHCAFGDTLTDVLEYWRRQVACT